MKFFLSPTLYFILGLLVIGSLSQQENFGFTTLDGAQSFGSNFGTSLMCLFSFWSIYNFFKTPEAKNNKTDLEK